MVLSEGILFSIFAMIGYGLADFLAKKAVDKYGPIISLKIAITSGTLAILLYSLFSIKFPALSFNTIIFVLLTGITGAIGWIAFYKSLKQGKVSIISPIASSWGIISFILAIAVLSEKLTLSQVLASISIFIGIFLVSVDWKKFSIDIKNKFYSGVGLALLAMITFGISAFFSKFVVDEVGAFYSVIFVRAILIPILLVYPSNNKEKFNINFIWLLILIGIIDALAYLSFNFGLLTGLVSIVSAITSAAPFIVVLLAYFFLKEKLKTNQYLGILLIIIGFISLSLF